ncbi:hypothetical protein HF324_18475 [Chitinophaga oryzae]|uniref:Uncharacterized protein n=1 Tax=Chitinophaga oryzae TaxID=2725414 RepID=A0ABX6LI20_9BACT|nr:hypothetical protein [Chitinophaga oryzae]QJB39735.1 hypothetical protein HF324_18475 [Chitinophaga oryzae]
MTLDDILVKHIPIPPRICMIKRMHLERQRWEIKQRIALQRDLDLVPEKILLDVEKTFGKLK